MRHHHLHCNVCNRAIRGRVHRWSNRIMCARCHRYFTRNVQKTSTTIKRFLRSQHSPIAKRPTRRSWLQRLFG